MPRRRFSHLSKVEIRNIVVSHFQYNETKQEIANRLSVDFSTVAYHIRQFETCQLESESDAYAQVKRDLHPHCDHPSFKCSLCGRHKDNLKEENRLVIQSLRKKIKQLEYNITRLKRRRNPNAFCREL